jgi:hypothetical protein
MRPRISILMLLLGVGGLMAESAAPQFFPLSFGNRWMYRSTSTAETREITVGTPVMTNGLVYWRVTGYAAEPVYMRVAKDGSLYVLDESMESEVLATRFSGYESYLTPIAECPHLAQPVEERVPAEGPSGMQAAAAEIRYQSMGCADTGLIGELYIENLGLVRRTVQTLIGPREFELVSARVGPITFEAQPDVAFRLVLERDQIERPANEPGELRASLALSVRSQPLRLRFPSGQRYDLEIKDGSGRTLALWSSGRFFTQEISEIVAGDLRYTVAMPLTGIDGQRLPDGTYRVHAWLTTEGAERRFAASAEISIRTAEVGIGE